MATFDFRIRKVKSYNSVQKKHGFATRAIINGMETFESTAEEAARNTTINKFELGAALGMSSQQLARALKNGFAIDLGPIGKIYPTVKSKWTETEQEQKKEDLTVTIRFVPSSELAEAMGGARLVWDNGKDGVEAPPAEDEQKPGTGGGQGGTVIPPGTDQGEGV